MIHRIKEGPFLTLVMGGVEEYPHIRTPPRIALEDIAEGEIDTQTLESFKAQRVRQPARILMDDGAEPNREIEFRKYAGNNKSFRTNWPRKLTYKIPGAYSWDYDQVTRNDDLVIYCVTHKDANGVFTTSGVIVFFKRKSASQRYLTRAYGKPYNSRQISLGYLFNTRSDFLIGAMKLLGFDESELF